jgi:hypothetical protein
MIINSPAPERTVFEYEFMFSSGQNALLTIDPAKQDNISLVGDDFYIYLHEKEVNGILQPTTNVVISKSKLDSYTWLERTITERTKEEEELWAKALNNPSNTIN